MPGAHNTDEQRTRSDALDRRRFSRQLQRPISCVKGLHWRHRQWIRWERRISETSEPIPSSRTILQVGVNTCDGSILYTGRANAAIDQRT